MKIRKLLVSAVLVLCLLAGMVGANAASSQIMIGAYPSTVVLDWDPASTYCGDGTVLFNIYETLLRYNSFSQEYEPLLATSYDVSDDGLTWTFHLREGVKFHDGTDFTASDVKYSIERTRDYAQGCSWIWAGLDVINVIDDYTAEFVLSSPFDLAEAAACQYAAYIYSDSLAAIGDNNAVADWFHACQECGTGPYMLQSFDASNCILTKFDGYWGGWEGNHFEKVVMQTVPESSTRRQMLTTGAADISDHLSTSDTEALFDVDGVTVKVEPVNKNDIIFFNVKNGPMTDINARKAVAYAYPYDDVINYVKLGKYGRMPVDVGGMSALRGVTDSMPYHYDLEIAKEYLAKSAYPDGFEMEVVFQTEIEDNKKAVELWKSELAKIGVTLNITPMAAAAAESRGHSVDFADRADAYMIDQWADTPSATAIWSSTSVKDASWNFTGIDYPELEALLTEATINMAVDTAKGIEQLKEIGTMAAEYCHCLNVCDKADAIVVRSDIEGAAMDPAYTNVVLFYNCSRAN